jgi:hypothetical protein
MRWAITNVVRCRRSSRIAPRWPITFETQAKEEPLASEVQIRRLGALAIYLRAANGLPVSGQEVRLHSMDLDGDVGAWIAEGRVKAPHGLTSDQRGEITIEGLPHGHYRWFVATAGPTLQGEANVPALAVSELTIALP